MLKFTLVISALLLSVSVHAQFAPQAGIAGSTAIHKDSNILINWAGNCSINRGWMDIADTILGKVNFGDPSKALGKADADVVSLGDGGEAVFFFENPIINGQGYDFAIFENGFTDPVEGGMAYLELAKVAVSNDGITYYSFASVCNNDTALQLAGIGEYMNATKINNLAGKYISGYGTPFELDELTGIPGLDLNNIRFIKITDVVGSINVSDGVRDDSNHIINDPYPTPFPTGGFDLDALSIIHQKYPTGIVENEKDKQILFYPNPTNGILHIKNVEGMEKVVIFSIDGKQVLEQSLLQISTLDLSLLQDGNYLLRTYFTDGHHVNQLIHKHE